MMPSTSEGSDISPMRMFLPSASSASRRSVGSTTMRRWPPWKSASARVSSPNRRSMAPTTFVLPSLVLKPCQFQVCLSTVCLNVEQCHRHWMMTLRKQLYSPVRLMRPAPEMPGARSLAAVPAPPSPDVPPLLPASSCAGLPPTSALLASSAACSSASSSSSSAPWAASVAPGMGRGRLAHAPLGWPAAAAPRVGNSAWSSAADPAAEPCL
mmetsp:Transcript_1117/g.3142  ORF Transcript_1117/g.3142 Transcript_1117/m.3142 type:complete len:211 (+) Transcript_1117:1383-2015(+)